MDKRLILRLGGPVRCVATLRLVARSWIRRRTVPRMLGPLPVVAQQAEEDPARLHSAERAFRTGCSLRMDRRLKALMPMHAMHSTLICSSV